MRRIFYGLCYVVSGALVYLDFFQHSSLVSSALYLILAAIFMAISSPVMLKVYLCLALAPWYIAGRKQQAKGSQLTWEPLVSVILPAYNEEVGLVGTIKTLLESTYSKIEIVVVNDGSTDDTHQRMIDFLVKYNQEMKPRP